MKFKAGDRVKFLNQKGGGVVSKIVNSQIVNVSVEDGFEIPTLISELVLVENAEKEARLFQEDIHEDNYPVKLSGYDEANEEIKRSSPIQSHSIAEGIYLVFVPHDQQWLVTGPLDIYLVNNTNFYTLFNLILHQDEKNVFEGIDYGGIEPFHKFLLDTIKRDDLNHWAHGVIQILFHADERKHILNPLSSEFKIKASRFYQENHYIPVPFVFRKALMLTLGKIGEVPVFLDSKENIRKEDPILKPQKAQQMKSSNILEKHMLNGNTAEIDLHIGELTDDYYLLSPVEILNIQLDYFMKCMDAAITHHIPKLIFIHGVGNGSLKNEIKKILKKYEGIHVFDASMAKYGVGATEVFIGQNCKLSDS